MLAATGGVLSDFDFIYAFESIMSCFLSPDLKHRPTEARQASPLS